MRHLLTMIVVLFLATGCANSPVNYADVSLSPEMRHTVAMDLAWLIKEKHGANATYLFDYAQFSRSTAFSESLEMALRQLGIGVYATDAAPVGSIYPTLQYTLSRLNDTQFYLTLSLDGSFSLQRVWIIENDTLTPLVSTGVFNGKEATYDD